MNLRRTIFSALFAILGYTCLHADVEFVGVSIENSETKIALVDTTSGGAKWVTLGGKFNGYTVASYDETAKSVLLSKDSAELRITLKLSKVVPTDQPATPQVTEYIIKSGDVPSKIAQQYDITIAELQALNPEVNWSKLHVGQKIRIK
jgi:LysM repeat protein